MRPILVLAILSLGWVVHPGSIDPDSPAIEVSTTTLLIPTYPYVGFLETHHSSIYNIDYPWLNWSAYEASGPAPSLREYTALVVENAWLRLTFLPALGGRLYGVTVKATGEELLYQNPVIKPTHWGPLEQGWWLAAGGVEWCLPVDEHGYEWGVPWDYSVDTTAAGATVNLWDTTAGDRLRTQIRVFLPADQAAFQISPRLENPTAAPVSFKFWDNAMLAPGTANTVGPELRFAIPINQVTVHSRGDSYLPGDGEAMTWPIYDGTDYSRLGNWNQWLGFFARPQAAEDWVGIYDEATLRGMARVFPHEVAVGVKGFAFGWSAPIDWHIWTDDGSYYVELHGGLAPTFWDEVTLDAGQALEWTETWLPLRDLPVLTMTTADLALGIKDVGADLNLGVVMATQQDNVGLRLWRTADCTSLWRVDGLSLAPDEAFTHQMPGLGLASDEVTLAVLAGGNLLAFHGELSCLAPESQVDPLATVQTTTEFAVSWSTADPGGVLLSYDIQVRDGDADAPWTDWLLDTTATSETFAGEAGHTYAFRSRARDIWGRVEDWPANKWQDTFTTVLLQPAPVLVTSDKVAQPPDVHAGDVMEFQIHPNNTGNLAATVHVTDTLPTYLALTSGPWSNQPPDPAFAEGTITWSGTLDAGQGDLVIGFAARVLEVLPGGVISNTVWIDDGIHPVFPRQVTIRGWLQVYLPVIVK